MMALFFIQYVQRSYNYCAIHECFLLIIVVV